MTVVAGSGVQGFKDGPAAVARFCRPYGIAAAPNGSYFVADWDNHAVRRVALDGVVTTVAGTGEQGNTDGPGEVATFDHPIGIAVDRHGVVFVTECFGGRIRKIARGAGSKWVVSTVVAAGVSPMGIAVDPAGHLVVADLHNHRMVRVDPVTSALAVIAGDGIKGFRDGPGATARLDHPWGVAVDRRGDIFVAECDGRRVRRISAADGVVTTVAGTGVSGHIDGAEVAAQFGCLCMVVVDGRGVLLVGDGWPESRLRRVAASADRSVTTVAVNGAPRHFIQGSAIDRDGSLLVAVPEAHRIFRVTGLGLVSPERPLAWSLHTHQAFIKTVPEALQFIETVLLCALRLKSMRRLPLLPDLVWRAVLTHLTW